jgi:hypothetical protein
MLAIDLIDSDICGAVVHLRAQKKELPVYACVVRHQPGEIQERKLIPIVYNKWV